MHSGRWLYKEHPLPLAARLILPVTSVISKLFPRLHVFRRRAYLEGLLRDASVQRRPRACRRLAKGTAAIIITTERVSRRRTREECKSRVSGRALMFDFFRSRSRQNETGDLGRAPRVLRHGECVQLGRERACIIYAYKKKKNARAPRRGSNTRAKRSLKRKNASNVW